MFKFLSTLTMLSCQGDIALIYSDKNNDSDTSLDVTDFDSGVEDSAYSTDLSGVSGYFSYELQQIACPQCFGLSREITVSFYGFYHETISDSHFENILTPGSCSDSDLSYRPSYNLLNHSNSIVLSGQMYSFDLSSNYMEYYTDQVYENQYERDTLYTVDSDVGSFNFTSIHGFDYIEPFQMLYVDPSYSFSAPISRSGQTFSWGPSGSDSEFEVSLEIFSYDGSYLLGTVTCSGYDTGSLFIPGSYISSYPANSLVAIILTRHKRDSSEYDPLNSFIETHMKWQVVGTGYIY